MFVLGIETSCDETSVAILNNTKVEVNLIASQLIHKDYGGVIPELSSRAHLQKILPLIKKAFKETQLDMKKIDLIAATAGPGLIGALLIGLTFGKSLALVSNKAFVPVNHIEGHIFSGFLMQEVPEYPYLCSVVSGGHTLLLLVKSEFEIIKLGTTIDDAIGEAFDKVSKIIGLEYPGGPLIQEYAQRGNDSAFDFPIGKSKNQYDFSFSGLKTAVLRTIQNIEQKGNLNENIKNDICASFQKASVAAITKRVNLAINNFDIKSLSLVGGVAANKLLREEFLSIGNKLNLKVVIPSLEYCGDNAAMIAYRGMQYHNAGIKFSLNSNAYPTLPEETFSI